MEFDLRALAVIIPILGMNFFAGSLRKRTETGELKVSLARFLIFAIVLGAIFAGAMAAADFLSGEASFDEWLSDALPFAFYGLIGGLIFATAALFFSSQRFRQSFRLKKVRSASIYGVCLASFFSVVYFILGFDHASIYAALLFFSAGFFGGGVFGALALRGSKRRVVGNKMIVPTPYSDRWTREAWKALLIIMIIIGVSIILSRGVFDSKNAWMGIVAGLFLGMVTSQLIWVLIYETRNKVRLVYDRSESGQPAESTA